MSMQISKVWWDGDKLMAEPINAADVYKPEPVTEWLTCPKCGHKSPYSPIKAKTLAEDAERITKQARAALAEQPAQQKEPVGRTDQEIVDQTEALAKWLLYWGFNHQPENDTPMRESDHPFAKRCWSAACQIQEMLTATDPQNAVAELDGAEKCSHCYGIGYDASGYACSCTQEAA